MRIAIVGSGISGIVAAHELAPRHEITVFEAQGHIGGHTNTIRFALDGRDWAIDTGFIVYNETFYPNFVRLLRQHDVPTQPTLMSFSVRCDRTGLEYNGTSPNTIFSQRRNLLRPSFWRMLTDIRRFSREAAAVIEGSDALTVEEFVAREGYSRGFAEHYLVPLGASLWSCPAGRFRQFPIRFVVEFLRNHAMLQVTRRPEWRVIRGGSDRYVEAFTRSFRERIRLDCPVRRVVRVADEVLLEHAGGRERFDHVIFACHADQALALLEEPREIERRLLGAFPYQQNGAVLHTDTSVLPRRRRAWASWNYHIREDQPDSVAVTYNMNILQGIDADHTFLVTLNDDDAIDSRQVIRRLTYHHPVYTTARAEAQECHDELIGIDNVSYCGAYWGYGFHEDGARSALAVSKALAANEVRA